MRSAEEWKAVCRNITAGYTPDGKKEETYASGVELAKLLSDLGVWKDGDRIVEIGSGNGRLAMGLYGHTVEYQGLEIIEPCVTFCQAAFRGIPGFAFRHVDMKNGRYWYHGALDPAKDSYPVEDGWADVVLALSVFSHTGTLAVANHLYSEMVRIAKPGGLVFTTWYFGRPDESERKTVYDRSAVNHLFTGLQWEKALPPKDSSQTGILCRT